MKAKHTQGEWNYKKIYSSPTITKASLVYCQIYSTEYDKSIAFAGTYLGNNKRLTANEAEANAKLITAAPKILFELSSTTEDLKKIADSLGKGHELYGMISGIIYKNQKIIEKAID